MNITVASVLKRIAMAAASPGSIRKTIFGFLIAGLIVLCLPLTAIAGLLSGTVPLDEALVQQAVAAELETLHSEEFSCMDNTLSAIEAAMTEAGFPDRASAAQLIYLAALTDNSQPDLVARLTACFSEEQSDGALIDAVNEAFGTQLSAEEFSLIMGSMRSTGIDTSDYVDPTTKNNLDLVTWAKYAAASGWGYVWGTSGSVLTRSSYAALLRQYPGEVGRYADFIEANWLGGRTTDCSGLIRGYFFLNPDSGEVEYGYNGYAGMSANAYYAAAAERGRIDTIPEIPGLAVWHQGHIGIYIGDGQVIEAMSTKRGVVQTQLSSRKWTHWLKIPGIRYIEDLNPEGGQIQ